MRPLISKFSILAVFAVLVILLSGFVFANNKPDQPEGIIKPDIASNNNELDVSKPFVKIAKINSVKLISADYFTAQLEIDLTVGQSIGQAYLGVQLPAITQGYIPYMILPDVNKMHINIDRMKLKDIPFTTKNIEIIIYHGPDLLFKETVDVDINWPGPEYQSQIAKSFTGQPENFSTISLVSINRYLPKIDEFIKTLLESGLPIQKIEIFGVSAAPCNNLKLGEDVGSGPAKKMTALVLSTFTSIQSVVIKNDESSHEGKTVTIGGCENVPNAFSDNTLKQLKDGNLTDSDFYKLLGFVPVSPREKVQVMYNQAYELLDSGRSENFDRAKSILDEIISIDPNFPRAYIELARYYMKKSGSRITALALAEKSLLIAKDIDPDLADTRVLLGYVYTNQRRYAEADKEYVLAEKIGTDNLWLYANWGLNYELQQKSKQAIEKYLQTFSKPRTLDRNDRPREWVYRYSHFFDFLIETKQYPLADSMYQKYFEEYPAVTCILQDQAALRVYYLKDFNKAIDSYLQAEKLGCSKDTPTIAVAYYMKWQSLKVAKAIEFDVVSTLRKAEAFSPADSDLFYNLAASDYTASVMNDLKLQGKNINFVDADAMTALLYAVNSGNKERAERLLKNGADINQVSGPNKYFALAFAVFNNDTKMVELLLKYHADISLKIFNGPGLEEVAKSQGNVEMIKLLSSHKKA